MNEIMCAFLFVCFVYEFIGFHIVIKWKVGTTKSKERKKHKASKWTKEIEIKREQPAFVLMILIRVEIV